MTKEDHYKEEFSYDKMSTLERGKQNNGNCTTDFKSSELQTDRKFHSCFHHRGWIYSLMIGSCLLIVVGFSVYLGNVFPDEMDYLRCAAGSCIPAAVVSFAVAKRRVNAMPHFQLLFISTFAITTTCMIWYGCKLVLNPAALNINFNLVLLVLLEILMASKVILSARSDTECCKRKKVLSYDETALLCHIKFPSRTLKSYSVVEVIVAICAVFGGIIALNMGALVPGPYLSVTFFWILAACFPGAIASHVAAEYPSKFLIEVLIAISSVTTPMLFTATGYLSSSIMKFVNIFRLSSTSLRQSYDTLVFVLMLLLLVQSSLSLATVIHCMSYKLQIKYYDSTWNMSDFQKENCKTIEASIKMHKQKLKPGPGFSTSPLACR
ncbi:membrane protein MLC1 isoform X2 [Scyliorhinus canicula]|uniref:membrane protein MLC1 isoform X2 n=1 Tax=Scyliorhinus canicula TaxID=7830 RepID=UPI0018F37BD6|nr:membrane protein MLC1 isoform X2 [Scyliorhinus canicula]